jgi:glycosyltransferase involved in cell wall biosynthesis
MAVAPLVSFVVPAYNEQREIGPCLESIRQASDFRSEVIVVDNNSTDETATVASKLADTVISCEKQGISAARNKGAAYASGDWIAFVDADARLCRGWLDAARPYFDQHQIGAVSGWNFFRETNPVLFPYFNGYNLVFFSGFFLALLMGKSLVVGNNLVIRKQTLSAAGGFPCYVGEDMKLSAILNHMKVRTSFSPGMRISYSSRRLRTLGFWTTMSLWIRSVERDIPEGDYRIDYQSQRCRIKSTELS